MTVYFDSHAHLDQHAFDYDREQVIRDAAAAGVHYVLNPGADLESSYAAVELAQQYEGVYAAVGVHPHDAKSMDEEMLTTIELLSHRPKVCAIGEIGLDFYRDLSPRDVQEHWFRQQIRLAIKRNLPIIIHDRDANDAVLRVLKDEKAFQVGVLMHSFSGSVELARQYVKLGAYISISGPVTYKNARIKREVAAEVPLDRLMIETDAPYLTAEPKRGMRNEPAFVRYTADKIAEVRGISPEEVAHVTLENTKRFFAIP